MHVGFNFQMKLRNRNVFPLMCFVLIPVWLVSKNFSGPRNYTIGRFQNLLPTDSKEEMDVSSQLQLIFITLKRLFWESVHY